MAGFSVRVVWSYSRPTDIKSESEVGKPAVAAQYGKIWANVRAT